MVEKVMSRWRKAGVALNPPAQPEALRALQQCLGVPLPSDVRHFFSLADGMPDGNMEEHLVSFWPIKKVLAEAQGRGRSSFGIPFADVLIESWRIYFQPSERGVSVAAEVPAFCFPSLDAFFERYMQEPGSLGLLE
jgi:hypothetical protein